MGALMYVIYSTKQGNGALVGYRNLTRDQLCTHARSWTGQAFITVINDESPVHKRGVRVCFKR